ncbi:MAG: thiamine phosphate synthase, partial [Bacteroidales bacterium]|nr:thiamine phosphate synthase [Bacteroidales bacterium]
MELIIITTDSFFEGEAKAINALFQEGLKTLHIRKPQCTKEELSLLLEQIEKQHLKRIVLHDHFELVNSFQLKGYHLNQRNNKLTEKHTDQTISRSCHSFEELQSYDSYDYLFL